MNFLFTFRTSHWSSQRTWYFRCIIKYITRNSSPNISNINIAARKIKKYFVPKYIYKCTHTYLIVTPLICSSLLFKTGRHSEKITGSFFLDSPENVPTLLDCSVTSSVMLFNSCLSCSYKLVL